MMDVNIEEPSSVPTHSRVKSMGKATDFGPRSSQSNFKLTYYTNQKPSESVAMRVRGKNNNIEVKKGSLTKTVN